MSPEFHKTFKGELSSGIVFEGEAQKSFSLREELLSDNLRETEEIEEVFGAKLTVDEQKLAIAKNCVQFARRLVSLGSIPREKIRSPLFLLENLSSRDYSALVFAKMELDREIFKALGLDPDEKTEAEAKKN